jgi:hypothetical protein
VRGSPIPEIPVVTAPRLVPPPEISPQIAGQPGETLARLGREFGTVADYGFQVASRIKDAQDAVLIQDAENRIVADIQKARMELANWSDFTQADQLKEQTAKTLRDKYSAQFANHPHLWRYLEPYLGRELNQYNYDVDVRRAGLISDFGTAGLVETLRNDSLLISNARSEAEKRKYEQHSLGQIQVFQDKGIINPLKAEEMRQAFFKTNEEAILTKLTRSPNPDDVARGISLLQDSNNFPHIPTSEQAKYLTAAEKHLEVVTEMAGKAQRDRAESTATQALQMKFPDDYDTQLEMLEGVGATTPEAQAQYIEWLKSVGLADQNGVKDMAAIKQTREAIDAMQADRKKRETEESDKAEKQITDAMATHDFVKARQLLKQSLPMLVKGKAEELDKAIVARAKRTDDDISNHEDAAEYLKIIKMMADDPDAAEREIIQTPHLKTTTRESLVKRLETAQDKILKSGLAMADGYLREQISATKDPLQLPGPLHLAKARDAQVALGEWIEQENARRATGRQKALTSQEIYEHAKEMVPAYYVTTAQEIQYEAEMKKRALQAQKPYNYTPEQLKHWADHYGITVDELKRRMKQPTDQRTSGAYTEKELKDMAAEWDISVEQVKDYLGIK